MAPPPAPFSVPLRLPSWRRGGILLVILEAAELTAAFRGPWLAGLSILAFLMPFAAWRMFSDSSLDRRLFFSRGRASGMEPRPSSTAGRRRPGAARVGSPAGGDRRRPAHPGPWKRRAPPAERGPETPTTGRRAGARAQSGLAGRSGLRAPAGGWRRQGRQHPEEAPPERGAKDDHGNGEREALPTDRYCPSRAHVGRFPSAPVGSRRGGLAGAHRRARPRSWCPQSARPGTPCATAAPTGGGAGRGLVLTQVQSAAVPGARRIKRRADGQAARGAGARPSPCLQPTRRATDGAAARP